MAEIVLVHGAWHGPRCWDKVVADLRQRGHTVRPVALPGHEARGRRARIWNTIGSYVAAIERAAAECDEAPVLVGHSMGGYVVQRYLEHHEATAAILVASVPRRGAMGANLRLMRRHPLIVLRATLTADYYGAVQTPELVRELFFRPDTPQEHIDDLAPKLQNESAAAMFTMLVRPPRPSQVLTPVHVVAAAADAIFTLDEQEDLAEAYGTEAIVHPGGHDLMLDSTWRRLSDTVDRLAARA